MNGIFALTPDCIDFLRSFDPVRTFDARFWALRAEGWRMWDAHAEAGRVARARAAEGERALRLVATTLAGILPQGHDRERILDALARGDGGAAWSWLVSQARLAGGEYLPWRREQIERERARMRQALRSAS